MSGASAGGDRYAVTRLVRRSRQRLPRLIEFSKQVNEPATQGSSHGPTQNSHNGPPTMIPASTGTS